MKFVTLAGALLVTVAHAQTFKPANVPAVNANKNVANAKNAEDTRKFTAFVHTATEPFISAHEKTSVKNVTRTSQKGGSQTVPDPGLQVTRIAGRSWGPFIVGVDKATKFASMINVAKPGQQPLAVQPGDAFNVIGNLPTRNRDTHYVLPPETRDAVATVTTTAPNVSRIDFALADGKPDAMVFVTPREMGYDGVGPWMPYAVKWDNSLRRWTIVATDNSGFGHFLHFNMVVFPGQGTHGDVRVHRFVVSNQNPDGPTRLPRSMAGKDDIVVLTPVIGAKGAVIAELVAVGIEPDTGLWQIVTPSKKVPEGAEFNVLVAKKTR
ncbi:MAG: hypothetical protein SFX73_08675 [Kofleriaceae bacterium]|nr:hypothetical protein [Kofleriaceae bacterium]